VVARVYSSKDSQEAFDDDEDLLWWFASSRRNYIRASPHIWRIRGGGAVV